MSLNDRGSFHDKGLNIRFNTTTVRGLSLQGGLDGKLSRALHSHNPLRSPKPDAPPRKKILGIL